MLITNLYFSKNAPGSEDFYRLILISILARIDLKYLIFTLVEKV